MLLIEDITGKVCGVGYLESDSLLPGHHFVEGPYTKNGKVVTNISEIFTEIEEIERYKTKELRQQAYSKESDPLYLEWQYDQTEESEQKWRDKVAEIKERYPLPTE